MRGARREEKGEKRAEVATVFETYPELYSIASN